MSRQEEVIQEFVLEQLDELGVDGNDCDISFIPAKGRKRNQIILTFPEELYYDVYEVLAPYLSELSDDFAYTFSGTATYKLCSATEGTCLSTEDEDEESDDFNDFSSLSEPYADGDVDDPDAQYAEEGLVIQSLDDIDSLYCAAEEDEDDD
jgi:hypothetical protein